MRRNSWRVAAGLAFLFTLAMLYWQQASPRAQATLFVGPTSSQPLALSADGSLLAVVNPDNDTVSFFNVAGGGHVKTSEVAVGDEPNGVALLPNGSKAYVTNTISGTVSVLSVNGARVASLSTSIKVGTEPYGVALTPNGTKLYVSNSRSNTVSVINTATNVVTKTIGNVGFEPRGLAISNDGDGSDTDERVYVTQFLSRPIAGKIDGFDDAKAGHVNVIQTSNDTVIADVALNPLADTGFKALGDALGEFGPRFGPPPAMPVPADFKFQTGAYANQLNNIAIHGNFAFVPNTGASPNGPFRFDVNTQSLLHVINRTTNLDANTTLNMHLAVAQQTNPAKRFNTIPWAMAFEHAGNEAWVVIAASNHVIKLTVDPATGAAEVETNPSDPGLVLQLITGKNPRGIVITPDDTRAFVMNYVSRDVTELDLTTSPEHVVTTFASAALPPANDPVHIGKELYNTSIGVFDPVTSGGPPIVGRMSNNGWGACAACHPNGLSDNVVWIFPDGPRRAIPQNTDFAKNDPNRQRILNWSAVRDEEEDFELNIRAVSGGGGLIVLAGTSTPDAAVQNLRPNASGDRNQLKVNGVNAWDAIEAFVKFGIRSPISPLSASDAQVLAGRQAFIQAGCQTCHGGPQWTSSRLTFTPPPAAARVKDGQLFNQLRNVGTFDPTFPNEFKNTAAPAIGGDGFVPASLLSLHAFPETFLHNGRLDMLDKVLLSVAHRSAGSGGVDTLASVSKRAQVIKFLLSIDGKTATIP
jgi:YVTN family beta-propeller protein